MTSRDEINLSEHPTDSLDNAFEESHSLNLNSSAVFSSSVAGPSGTRSGNNDPINDIALYDDLDLEDENFIRPSENLTKDNLISNDPFKDDDCISESSGKLFISLEDSSNLLTLDEPTNDVEASLDKGLINKDETFKNASLQETPFNETETYQQKEISQITSMSLAYEDSSWVNFGASTSSGFGDVSEREKGDIKVANVLEENGSPLDETGACQQKEISQINSMHFTYGDSSWVNFGASTSSGFRDVSGREKGDIKVDSVLEEIDSPLGETEANQQKEISKINSMPFVYKDSSRVNFGASTSYGFGDVSGSVKSDIKMASVLEKNDSPLGETEAQQQKEISQINPMPFVYKDSSRVNFGASTSSGFGDVSGRKKSDIKMASVLEEIDSPLGGTAHQEKKRMPQISFSSTAHNVFWLNLGVPTSSDLGDVSEIEKSGIKTTSVLEEIDTPLDETEANQLKEMPEIISSSTNENLFRVNFGASTSGVADVSEREKNDIKMTGVSEIWRSSFNGKHLRKEHAGNVGRSFEQSKFETPDCNLSDYPLYFENKSLHTKQDLKRSNILRETILPQNTTRNDVLGKGNYLLNAPNTVDENDSNKKIWPEFACNDTKSGNKVNDHGNPFEIRKHHDRNPVSNNNTDTQPSHLSMDELFKYQELKTLTNNTTRNDVLGKGNYLLNAPNTVDENDSNKKIWPEFACNDTKSGNKVSVHGNPFEIRKHHDRIPVSNNKTDSQPSDLSMDELFKYQELKTITNNFFRSCQRSSLHEDQRKETFLEVESEIKTTNSPSLIKDYSPVDKGDVNTNCNDNAQNNIELTEDCKFEYQLLNMNENITAEIPPTSIQDIENSNLTNENDSGKYGNTAVISNNANNDKTHDYDNSNEGLLSNEFNCNCDNLDSNKMESKLSSPRICSLATEGDNFSTASETPGGACLEKEMHMPVQSLKNNTTHAINNIFCAETNDNSDSQQIFNTECQNGFSASTSNRSSMQFMNITADNRQNADLFDIIDESTQNDNEPTGDCKFEPQISNTNENVTAEISSTSVKDIANSNLTNKSDSREDISTAVISHAEDDHFPTSSGTSPEACLEKERHIPVQPQKNSTAQFINNTSLAETNGNYDCQKIFNATFQNIDSASTSGLNSVPFMSMTSDYQQNACLFQNMEDNFAVQESISDRKQTTEDSVVDENIRSNICIFEQSSEIKCSPLTNANTATQPFINESKTTQNCISYNNKTPMLSDMYEIIENKESLQRQAKTPDFKNDDENTISFESPSIPPNDSESTEAYITENKQFDKSSHQFENPPIQDSITAYASDSYEHLMKSQQSYVKQEDIKHKLILPPTEELVGQNTNLRRSQRLLNLSKRLSNTATVVTTTSQKELNYDGTEKQTSKRISTDDQTIDAPRDSKKLKSCEVQPKSRRTTCKTITKDNFVSTENSRKTGMISDIGTSEREKQTSKRTLPKDESIYSLTDSKKLKSCKTQPKSLSTTSQTETKGDFVSAEKPRKTVISSDISAKEDRVPSSYLRMAEVLRKYDNKRQEPSTSKNNELEFGPRKFNDIRTGENSSLSLNNSCEVLSTNEESIPSSFLRMAKVLRKYDNTVQEPSTAGNNKFEPRIFADKTMAENSSLSLSHSCEGTSAKKDIIPSSFLRMAEVLRKYDKKLQEPTTAENNEFEPKIFTDERMDENLSLSHSCEGTSANKDNIPSSFLRMAQVLRKYDNKAQEPSIAENNEFEPRIFTDKRTDENSPLSLSHSCEGTSANKDSIPSSYLRMAEVLRKYDKKAQEPTTAENNVFEPGVLTENRTDGNSSLPPSNSGEGTSAVQTVFDATVTAVKQLNSGNGSTVLDIVSYVRSNLLSNEKKLSQDVRKALKDATAAGFLAFANGKYKEIPKSREENTSKEPTKRKTTRANDNSKTQSKRLKLAPTVPTRSLRPRTTHLTRESSVGPKKEARK